MRLHLDHSSAQNKRGEFLTSLPMETQTKRYWMMEETFVAEENKESPEEVPRAEGEQSDFTVTTMGKQ